MKTLCINSVHFIIIFTSKLINKQKHLSNFSIHYFLYENNGRRQARRRSHNLELNRVKNPTMCHTQVSSVFVDGHNSLYVSQPFGLCDCSKFVVIIPYMCHTKTFCLLSVTIYKQFLPCVILFVVKF